MSAEQSDATTMRISRSFLSLLFLAGTGVLLWVVFAWPRIAAIPMKIDRVAAVRLAGVELTRYFAKLPDAYRSAAVYGEDTGTMRFLQKALGVEQAAAYAARHGHELFGWSVRFFRPGEKEEFYFTVSAQTGEITSWSRMLEQAEERPDPGENESLDLAKAFLADRGVDLEGFELKDRVKTVLDRRVDYGFSWRKKGADVVWGSDPQDGSGKVLAAVHVSGHEVVHFDRMMFDVPERFKRYLESEAESGRNLSFVFSLVYLALLAGAIVLVVRTRAHAVLQRAQVMLALLGAGLCVGMTLGLINQAEFMYMGYPTTQNFSLYVGRWLVSGIVSALITSVGFVLVALAGEGCAAGVSPGRDGSAADQRSFLGYIRSSFMSRQVTRGLLSGYAVACFLLGLQAWIFFAGERYFGVWAEQQLFTQFSTAYWPWLSAFLIALRAGLTEEVMFRVFLLNWAAGAAAWPGLRLVAAVILSAVIWGIGHSNYQIYPMWFRGVEVSILGIVLGWAYLRFGLVCVLCAHFLFDAFWSGAGASFSGAAPGYFYSCLVVLLLPFVWAIVAFVLNRPACMRPVLVSFTEAQQFNLRVIRGFLLGLSDRSGREQLKAEFLSYHWDPLVVETAFEDVPEGYGENENAQAGSGL